MYSINVVFSKNKTAPSGTVQLGNINSSFFWYYFLTYSFMRLYQYNEDDLSI